MFDSLRIEVKTSQQIDAMRVAGLVVGRALEAVRAAVAPGVSTGDLDAIAEASIRDQGGIPSFIGYGTPPFPASICASVNEEVVHGIPGRRILRPGDVVSIDCGAIVDGWHGDAAITVPVGSVRPEVAALLEATERSLWAGLAAAVVGGRVGDISNAVETSVRASGDYGIVDDYTGHGIGTALHMEPDVPNTGRARRGPRLRAGMALAVEPMITLGRPRTVLAPDQWTVATADGTWAAHFEHTVALTDEGPWVLTALDGGRERLAGLGAACGART